jgi:hypothetical protein
MIIKAIEIRDAMTFIPAIAIKLAPANEGQRYLLRRAGYQFERSSVILQRLTDNEAQSDPHSWSGGARTMPAAHEWLLEHFDSVNDGDVIDVEHILGLTPAPKASERFEAPL